MHKGVDMSKKKQQGGYLKGPSHKNGGMPAIVAGQEPVELEGGEYIVQRKIVDAVGKENMDKFNKTGRMPAMKKGGKVKKKQMGGRMAPPMNPRFKKNVRYMEGGGEVSVTNDKATVGDIATVHSHSGYKVGK